MKTIFTLLLFCTLGLSSAFAQAPQAMKYQTVVRDADGAALSNTNVGLRLTVLENGTDVYQETWDVNTSEIGLVNLNLGQGTSVDDFSAISWSAGAYALQVELDVTGGTNYALMGSSPLLSVPFALKAQSAETVENDNVEDADADPNNEIQTLSLDGNALSLSGSNTVTLPSGGGSDVEPEQLSKAWARVQITGTHNPAFDSHNVVSSSKVSTGVYVIVLEPGLFSPATNPSVQASVINDLSPGFAIATYSSSPSQITIRTYDTNGQLSDRAFSLTVFGK